MRLACTGLLSWFEKKASVVTPTPVLAAVAAQQFSTSRLDRNIDSWQRPEVYSIDAWLASCWQEARYSGSDVPALLSPSQERLLWQRIIEREQPDLFDPNATARLARRAANLVAEWRIPLEGELWNDHQDAQQFLHWHKLFSTKCRDEGWIARSDLWSLLPFWIGNGLWNPGLTVFAGFTTTTPALDRVKQALGRLAVFESASAAKPREPAPAKLSADFNQEIELAARWARAAFEQAPTRSIGIFVPDLSIHRAVVERTFQQVFYPSAALRSIPSEKDAGDSVFHLNAAAPLTNHPLIASALLLLELAWPRIDQADACAILRCPFITGAAAERGARAFADLELRRRRELDVSLRDMEFASKNCPGLNPIWSAIRRVLRARAKYLESSAWSEFMGDLLEAVGWPGDSELNSQEQEVFEKWKNALSKLAALGLVSGEMSYGVALAHLRRLLSISGLDRGDWSSPIQILDASDASSLEFDRAFLVGLSDETWPQPVDISPLVPLKLQRTHYVTGSSPQSTQIESQRATQSLFGVAPVLFGTYSGRLSPLVEPFVTLANFEYSRWQGKLPRQSYTPISLNEIEDSDGPPYQENESTRGGASIVKSQSLCPFRAFAEFRLAAKAPDEACLGFDSRDRGGFLHKALQSVWQSIQTQDRLIAMPPEELRAMVCQSVNAAVTDRQSSPFHTLASQTERERLEELILEWLGVERRRKQPFTVETVEQQRFYDTPGLRLRLRVDRMDRLKNGKLLLIDYKSGPQTRGKLKCPRPPEPQLLVYASAVGSEVDGVFFGEIKPRDPRAVGFARERHFPGSAAEVRKDWDTFRAESQEEVRRIAKEFVDGYAAIDPIRHACEYCSLKPLCRVNEAARAEQEDE